MKDHYRPQKMALWMNLIPDLQSAAMATHRGAVSPPAQPPRVHSSEDMLDYRLYNELLPFVPKLKNLDANAFNRYLFTFPSFEELCWATADADEPAWCGASLAISPLEMHL